MFTYAAPNASEGTASGQVSARVLRHLYRAEKFSRAAKIYGVIADPVRHSISPAVHNRAFQAHRIDAVYLPFLVQPAQLKDFFILAESLPVAGFSVTIPHKQKIIRYLDVVDPLARRIGAVNTVWKKAGKWRGANTDADAVTVPLSRKLRLSKSSVLVVGNGGAARSAAYALIGSGAKVSIVGRNPDRVRSLARACGAESLLREQMNGRKFDALVHATPLGMFPHPKPVFSRRHPRRVGLRHGVQPARNHAAAPRRIARFHGDLRAPDVSGTGHPAVRDLDRRHPLRARSWRRPPSKPWLPPVRC
jgi:3-dehydroquinate dehydratase/shikimate dehydrogenase